MIVLPKVVRRPVPLCCNPDVSVRYQGVLAPRNTVLLTAWVVRRYGEIVSGTLQNEGRTQSRRRPRFHVGMGNHV